MTDDLKREVREIGSREEWHDWRQKDITASNIAGLFEGADQYTSMDKLVAHVTGNALREQTPSMRAGILLEHVFPAALAEERPDWMVTKATTYHRIPSLRLGCTPDFWIGDDGLCQAKSVNERQWEYWQARPPLGYTLQTLCELLITGRQWGVLAVIVRNSTLPLYLFDIARHPGAEAKLLQAVADFWGRYDAGEFPVAVAKDEIAAMLDDGSHVDLSRHNQLPEWLERREQLMVEIAQAERSKKGIDYEIKQRMGAASTGWLEGWQISYKTEHRKGYTVEPSDPRILRVKRTKEMGNE